MGVFLRYRSFDLDVGNRNDISPFAILMVVLFIYLILVVFDDWPDAADNSIFIFSVTTLGYDRFGGRGHVINKSMPCYYTAQLVECFVVKGVAPDVPLETIFRGVWPFLIE